MGTRRRKFFRGMGWSALGLTVLLALAVLIVELMSWNFLKPMIVERVEAATGRKARIDGDVTLTLFPRPRGTVERLTIENPDWSELPVLFQAQRVSVTPSIGDLLKGQLVLDEVQVESPQVNLERGADGSASWSPVEREQPAAKSDEQSGKSVSARHLRISDAQVNYRDPEVAEPLSMEVSSLEMHDDGEALSLVALIRIRNREFVLEANAASLDKLRSEAALFEGRATLESDNAMLEVGFALPEGLSMERLRANWSLAVTNLGGWSKWIVGRGIDLEALEFAGRLERDEGEWRLSEMRAAVDETRVSGDVTFDMAASPVGIEGALRASNLDMVALAEVGESLDEEDAPEPSEIAVLPELRGGVSVAVERLLLEQAMVENLNARLAFEPHVIALEELRFAIGGGNASGAASVTSGPDAVLGNVKLAVEGMSLAELGVGATFGGVVDAELDLELPRVERRPQLDKEALLERLVIEKASVAYVEEAAGTDLQVELKLEQSVRTPLLAVDGRFQDRPIDIAINGEPLAKLTASAMDYSLEARAKAGQIEAQGFATLGALISPEELAVDLEVTLEGSEDLETWLGRDLPRLPQSRVAARLTRDEARWVASDIEARIGQSRLRGRISYQSGERPSLEAELESDRLVLPQLLAIARRSSDAGQDASADPKTGPELAPLRAFDGRLDLRVDTLLLPGGQALQEVVVSAKLLRGKAQIALEQLEVAGGSVTAGFALDAGGEPATGRLEARFEDVHVGQLRESFLAVEDRVGALSGVVRIEITRTRAEELRDDVVLPFLGRVRVEPSQLTLKDADAGTDLTLRFQTTGAGDPNQTFEIDGEGQYDGAPFSLQFRGDPILDARDPDRPYGLDLLATAVDTEISVQGSILQPLALKGLDLKLALSGPDPQRLSRLLGLPLPLLPPYSISGDLLLEEGRWTITELDGRVGDSDLGGELAFDPNASPPRLQGDLRSDSLDLDDLGGLIGATPAVGEDEIASEEQVREAEEAAREPFVLPDEPVIGEAWDKLSADLRYHGRSVRVAGVPMSDLVLDFRLEDGRAKFEPVSFGVGNGSVDFHLEIDARNQPPKGTMHVAARGVDLRQALKPWELASESVGVVAGRGKFWVEGASLAELLASADGGMVLLMTDGKLDALLVELAGLDAGEAVLSWIQNREAVQVYCAYADVQVRSGIARLDTFVIDSDDTTFTAGGKVDFNNETLDVTVAAHPKDASAFVGRTPLHLGGTFANVQPGVHGGQLAARVTGSALLAAVGGPVAALAPLLDVGTGEDSGICGGLVGRTNEAMKDAEVENE